VNTQPSETNHQRVRQSIERATDLVRFSRQSIEVSAQNIEKSRSIIADSLNRQAAAHKAAQNLPFRLNRQ
jgi:rRNA maturation endonuclease Nob1